MHSEPMSSGALELLRAASMCSLASALLVLAGTIYDCHEKCGLHCRGIAMKYFCPAAQRNSVIALLNSAGISMDLCDLYPVEPDGRYLQGVRDCKFTFVHIVNHPHPASAEIIARARHAGMIELALSDQWRRDLIKACGGY